MFRKLIALALVAAGVAAVVKKRSESEAGSSPEPFAGAEQAAEPAEPTAQQAPDQSADDLAEVREGQTKDTVESPVVGVDDEVSVIPDTSDDDPLVRQQENAAAADAGSIGGEADTVTADTDPEMRPVVEGAGDAPETFETTEDQGR